MTFPFRVFAEQKMAGKATKQAFNLRGIPVTYIGGFIPGIEKTEAYFLTEVKKSEFGLVKTPVLFTQDDYKFLYQFPKIKWMEAMAWRYGEGLQHYAIRPHERDQTTIILRATGPGLPDMYFPNVKLYMDNLFSMLTKTIEEGGYGYMLSDDPHDWKVDRYEVAGSKGRTDRKITCNNYTSPTIATLGLELTEVFSALGTGFLDRPEDKQFTFAPIRSAGKPKKSVYLNWDGHIVNPVDGAQVVPCWGRGSEDDKEFDLEKNGFNPDVVKFQGHDPATGAVVLSYKYYTKDNYDARGKLKPDTEPQWIKGQVVPRMLNGRMFAQPKGYRGESKELISEGVIGYEKTIKELQSEIQSLYELMPRLRDETVVSLEDVHAAIQALKSKAQKQANPQLQGKMLEEARDLEKQFGSVQGVAAKAKQFLPGAGAMGAIQVDPAQQRIKERESLAKKTHTIGSVAVGYGTFKTQPPTIDQLNSAGLTGSLWSDVVALFAVAAPGQVAEFDVWGQPGATEFDFLCLSPSGKFERSQITLGLEDRLKSEMASGRYKEPQIQEYMAEWDDHLRDEQLGRVSNALSGHGIFAKFVNLLSKAIDLPSQVQRYQADGGSKVQGGSSHLIELMKYVQEKLPGVQNRSALDAAWKDMQRAVRYETSNFVAATLQHEGRRGGKRVIGSLGEKNAITGKELDPGDEQRLIAMKSAPRRAGEKVQSVSAAFAKKNTEDYKKKAEILKQVVFQAAKSKEEKQAKKPRTINMPTAEPTDVGQSAVRQAADVVAAPEPMIAGMTISQIEDLMKEDPKYSTNLQQYMRTQPTARQEIQTAVAEYQKQGRGHLPNLEALLKAA